MGDGMPNDPEMDQSKETRHETRHIKQKSQKRKMEKIKCGTTEKKVTVGKKERKKRSTMEISCGP